MSTSVLKGIGGSVMLALPLAVLNMLQINVGSEVNLTVKSGCLLIEPVGIKQYSLDELLNQCDPTAPLSDEDRQWTGSEAKGSELI